MDKATSPPSAGNLLETSRVLLMEGPRYTILTLIPPILLVWIYSVYFLGMFFFQISCLSPKNVPTEARKNPVKPPHADAVVVFVFSHYRYAVALLAVCIFYVKFHCLMHGMRLDEMKYCTTNFTQFELMLILTSLMLPGK